MLGPFDRRTKRSRCEACARRQIRCEGGSPCSYCTKKGQKCSEQACGKKNGPVFINLTTPSRGSNSSSVVARPPAPVLCPRVSQGSVSQFIGHFFSVFLVTNDFACRPLDLETITSQFQKSSSLYHAIIAIGALDANKKLLPSSAVERKAAKLEALTAYRTSITNFRTEIEDIHFSLSYSCLWTTFFLGLFELMYDVSGERWMKHFLYGTSKILQLRGPETHISGPGRSFFLTVRVFEICRSLIYQEPTFLCQPDWMSLTSRMWNDDYGKSWHPKEALFDLMIECSTLSHRVWGVLAPNSKFPLSLINKALLDIASNGLDIQTRLKSWYTNFLEWSSGCPNSKDTQSTLATIYYHATCIFLSGIFDYRPQFNYFITPTLPLPLIQSHTSAIVSSTREALKSTNLGGVLFFFPLRVAGARTTSSQQKKTILSMLSEVSKRSFVVADAFTTDLQALWRSKGV